MARTAHKILGSRIWKSSCQSIFNKRLIKMKVFVDVGAYIGDTIELAIRKYQDFDLFVGYEPSKRVCDKAIEYLSFSDRVKMINAGVGVKKERVKLWVDHKDYLSGEYGLGSSVFTGKKGCSQDFEWVNIVPIQSIINEYKNDYLVLKFNAEGVEYPIMEYMAENNLFRFVDELYVDWHVGKISGIGYDEHWRIVDKARKAGAKFTGVTRGDSLTPYVTLKDNIPVILVRLYYVFVGRKMELIFKLKSIGRKVLK